MTRANKASLPKHFASEIAAHAGAHRFRHAGGHRREQEFQRKTKRLPIEILRVDNGAVRPGCRSTSSASSASAIW